MNKLTKAMIQLGCLVVLCGCGAETGEATSAAPNPQEDSAEAPPDDVFFEGSDAMDTSGEVQGEPEVPQPLPAIDPRCVDERCPAGPNVSPDPSTWGPYPVGVRTIEVERLTEQGESRRFKVDIWYPTQDSHSGGPFEPIDIRESANEEQRALMGDVVLPVIEVNQVRDAPMRMIGEAWPLVLFSHGAFGVRFQSVFWTVFLASHGYVVASCDHPGNTMYELLTEGWSQVGMVESALVREADVLAMLSALEERAEMPDDGLFRAIDFEQIGMSGHSFGGLTTFLVACNEPRVRAMVPMTPVTSVVNILSPCALRDFTVPMMMMTAGLDGTLNTTREMRDPYRTFQMERYYVELLTAGHFSFSDICALDLEILANEVGISTGGALKDGCGPENMAIEDAHHLIRSFSIGFLNHQLRASPGSYEFYGPNAGLAASDHLLYSEGNFSR